MGHSQNRALGLAGAGRKGLLDFVDGNANGTVMNELRAIEKVPIIKMARSRLSIRRVTRQTRQRRETIELRAGGGIAAAAGRQKRTQQAQGQPSLIHVAPLTSTSPSVHARFHTNPPPEVHVLPYTRG